MSTLFEYEKTEVEEGYYILRISLQGSELIIAEHLSGSWYQPGADYDVWRWSGDPMPKIEIICGLDLDKIAVAAEAEEPLSPVDSRELIERLVKALEPFAKLGDDGWGSACPSERVLAVWWADDDKDPHKTKRPHITQGDIRNAQRALLAAKEQQP